MSSFFLSSMLLAPLIYKQPTKRNPNPDSDQA